MKKLIRKEYSSETKVKKDRILTVRISTSNPDRSKDIVVPSGVKLDNYLRNPVVALSHKYDELAIAKTENISVTDDGIVATLRFPDKGVYSVADTVYELYKEGFMSAWSIGFIPTEVEDIDGGGRLFKEWELLEYSAVLVPDNPEALTLIRSKSIDTKEFEDVVNDKTNVVNKIVNLSILFKQDEPVAEPPKEEEKPVEPEKPESGPTTEQPVQDEPKVDQPAEPVVSEPAESGTNESESPQNEPKPESTAENKPVEKLEEKPYPNEHACRLRQPSDFQPDSFRRTTRDSDGKEYSVIMGRLKGETNMTEQAYRYGKDIWTEASARSHCRSHDGISFEAATGDEDSVKTEVETKDKHIITGKTKKIIMGVMEQLEMLTISLKTLLELTVSEPEETEKENHKLVIGLVDGLKLADQIVGKALRDYKAMADLGTKNPMTASKPSGKNGGEN